MKISNRLKTWLIKRWLHGLSIEIDLTDDIKVTLYDVNNNVICDIIIEKTKMKVTA